MFDHMPHEWYSKCHIHSEQGFSNLALTLGAGQFYVVGAILCFEGV